MAKYLLYAFIFGLSFNNSATAQQKYVDSLTDWLHYHPVDSLWILNAHRVSYRTSETDIRKSFSYYERVSAASDSLHFTYGKALAQINLALLLFNSANFDASNKAYFRAIEYAEKGSYERLIAISLNNIGENFKILKDYDKCREYTRRAIEINRKLGVGRGVAINNELLFRCSMDEQKYDDAAANLNAGLKDAEESKDSYVVSPYYLGYGRLAAIYHRPDSATYFFTKALQEADVEDDLRNKYEVYLCRATTPLGQTQQQQFSDLNAALRIARQTEYLKGIGDAAEQLSLLYDVQGGKDSALFYFRIYRTASDSLFSENNKRNVIIRESEWVLRRKDAENDHLKKIAVLQQKEIVTKNSLLIGGAIMLVLAIALGVLSFAITRSKTKRIAAERKKKEAELKSQITEMQFKAFKAQLNPHFIFNYLNSISGHILLSQPEKASGMIVRFSKLLRTVLRNSEQNEVALADDIQTIEQYIELMSEIAAPPFTYRIAADPSLKDSKKMVPPLFIQPYVENAIIHGLKHADTDRLELIIAYRQKGTTLEITIADNGIGFLPDALRNRLMQGEEIHLGLSLTEKRIQVFAEKNGYGAAIRFSPVQPGRAQPGTQVEVTITGFFGD